jgi:general secretion pathway protein K
MKMRQRGSVIIVTLWTITLMTILVAAIAAQNRLSAQAAYFHQQDVENWAQVLGVINQAEMEILLEQMPPPVIETEDAGSSDSFAASINEALASPAQRQYRHFNGKELELYYPQPDDMAVRIYSHAGKINIGDISTQNLRAMIEKKLGGRMEADQQQIDDMIEAWNDWRDLNEGASVNGAENDYYMSLDPPYLPRNGALETVEELLQIRGFAEVFGDVDLDAAFTVYGEEPEINLNLATLEAMRLLPGLDDELIAKIVAFREEKEFQGNGDVAQLVPAEIMSELRGWLNSRGTSEYYTIMVYKKTAEDPAVAEEPAEATPEENMETDTDPENVQTAYAEIVFAPNPTDRPRILKVNPYQPLPAELHIADPESEEEDPE